MGGIDNPKCVTRGFKVSTDLPPLMKWGARRDAALWSLRGEFCEMLTLTEEMVLADEEGLFRGSETDYELRLTSSLSKMRALANQLSTLTRAIADLLRDAGLPDFYYADYRNLDYLSVQQWVSSLYPLDHAFWNTLVTLYQQGADIAAEDFNSSEALDFRDFLNILSLPSLTIPAGKTLQKPFPMALFL